MYVTIPNYVYLFLLTQCLGKQYVYAYDKKKTFISLI